MRWLSERVPVPLLAVARIAFFTVVVAVGLSMALWLVVEGLVLLAAGVGAAGALLLAFFWDRPRRKRLRAELARAQQAPGSQALRSEVGARLWTDRLPQPLRAIAQIGPFILVAIGVLMLAFVLIEVFGRLGPDDLDTHVRLEEGSSGEVEPTFGKVYRIRVTIVSITDGVEAGDQARTPRPGNKYWAAEVLVENRGSLDVSNPAWTIRDSEGFLHNPTPVGVSLPLLGSLKLSPGEARSGWVVFQVPKNMQPRWLRVTPHDPLERFEPTHLYFDAD